MSVKEQILINVGVSETRIAIVQDGRLAQIIVEQPEQHLLGSIYLGRVERVVPGVQAAFVDIGEPRDGFLAAREARALAKGGDDSGAPDISGLVHEGESVLVQVTKEPMAEKGARLTAGLSLPGRNLVYVPGREGDVYSRRLEDEAKERLEAVMAELRKDGGVSGDGGFILRTAAAEAGGEDLTRDAEYLNTLWRQVAEEAENAEAPARLYQDLDPVSRALRDHMTPRVEEVLIDDADAFNAAREFAARALPSLAERVTHYAGPGLLFDKFEVEAEIAEAMESRVELTSGGSIAIEDTEALTAIDVNSGRFVDRDSLEETGYRTNMAAAAEIPRQLRLRGIGGVIVVDFVHMAEEDHVTDVLRVLGGGLDLDPAPTHMTGMSELGLVEMTRKRTADSLAKRLTRACRVCDGLGRTRTTSAIADEALRGAEREALAKVAGTVVIRAAEEIIDWLEGRGLKALEALEARLSREIELEVGEHFSRARVEISVE